MTYHDQKAGFTYTATQVTSETVSGKHLHFSGNGKLSGSKSGSPTFTADADDNSTNGKTDTFSISLGNGYSASGTFKSGNIQIGK